MDIKLNTQIEIESELHKPSIKGMMMMCKIFINNRKS